MSLSPNRKNARLCVRPQSHKICPKQHERWLHSSWVTALTVCWKLWKPDFWTFGVTRHSCCRRGGSDTLTTESGGKTDSEGRRGGRQWKPHNRSVKSHIPFEFHNATIFSSNKVKWLPDVGNTHEGRLWLIWGVVPVFLYVVTTQLLVKKINSIGPKHSFIIKCLNYYTLNLQCWASVTHIINLLLGLVS